jgi:hypothetical protein
VEKAASHATTLPAAVRRREVTRLIVDNFGSAIKEHRIMRRTCPEAIFDPPLRGSTSPAVPAMPGTTAEGHQSVSSAVAARFIRVEIANLIPCSSGRERVQSDWSDCFGHEEQFPPLRLGARYRLCQPTFIALALRTG